MGIGDPKTSVMVIAACALIISLLSATQDVAIDAYRIEILDPEEYGVGAAVAIYGWHTGAFLTGAGALYVAASGGWGAAYIAAGCVIGCLLYTSDAADE